MLKKVIFYTSLALNVALFAYLFGFHGIIERLTYDYGVESYFEQKPQLVRYEDSNKDYNKSKFPHIEFHGHIFRKSQDHVLKLMNERNTRYLVNLFVKPDLLIAKALPEFEEFVKEFTDPRVVHFTQIDWRLIKESDFQGAADLIEAHAKLGAKGIKSWKNLGLYMKDKEGRRVAVDDPRLDPIWRTAEKYNLVVALHTVDPIAFFDPIDKHNERIVELKRKPDWSFHGDKWPQRNDVLAERDRLFKKFPGVTFVGLHVASYGNDLRKLEKLLDENPNVYVDIAQRIDELGRQPYAFRKIALKYQDRILFGSDGLPVKGKLNAYFRFLESRDEFIKYDIRKGKRKGMWRIHGVGLPDKVLRKIYYGNAARLLGLK